MRELTLQQRPINALGGAWARGTLQGPKKRGRTREAMRRFKEEYPTTWKFQFSNLN